jgi:hypothetical protein
MWCKNAVLQFGRFGCKRAHDRLEIAGCAGPVIGEMECTADGKVLASPGCRIGETNALCHVRNRIKYSGEPFANLRPAEISNRSKRVHDLFLLWPGDVGRKRLRSALDIARRELENDISKPLEDKISDHIQPICKISPQTLGVVSRSNTKAWKSCANEMGINSQLPNHHGRLSNQPLESRTLNKNSILLVPV